MSMVAEFMKREKVVSCRPDATLREAAQKMTSHGVGSILILGEGMRLEGIFTERDLARALASGADPDRDPISKYASRNVVTVAPYESIEKAGQKMLEHGVRHVPVVDSTGRVLGVLSIRDALRALLASHEFP